MRVASVADLGAAAQALGWAPAGLAPALLDPRSRVLVDGRGGAVLLHRRWADDGTAEAVIVRRAGVSADHPDVRATAVGWGCDRVREEGNAIPVPPPPDRAPLAERFRHLAALAATRVEVAVALAPQAPDDAAHVAAAEVLGGLGVPLLSEERRDPDVGDGPWIVLDPLDGTGNFSAGLPPWAFSAALVQAGRPVAGVVADLSSGRRWSGADGAGAERDGVPVRPRVGTTVVVPSAPAGDRVTVPLTARRIRITGCTAVELCLVADGSAAGWHDLDRSGTHVHDVAGGLAVLLAAGGAALDPEARPLVLPPDTGRLIRLVAAPTVPAAEALLDAGRP